ncbi:MAG: transposase [Fidelibacterota bacterium]
MIKRTNTSQSTLSFDFTFCKHLSRNNRWVRLADLIPWDELGSIYEEGLSKDKGAPTIPSRVVIGALIIKHMKNLSDEETIEDIRENSYYQYFLGYSSFCDRQVFAPSLFVEIRKRLGAVYGLTAGKPVDSTWPSVENVIPGGRPSARRSKSS